MSMFELLKTVLRKPPKAGEADGALVQWAHSRLLSHMALTGGAFALGGRLMDRPFRAECAESSHAYIPGVALLARSELDLPTPITVILLNRSLMRWLLAQRDTAPGTDASVVDLIQQFTALREVGWDGPLAAFWARYAVLANDPDVARHWVDADTESALMAWPEPIGGQTPMLFVLARGKCSMRMQVAGQSAVILHALDLFEHLCARALQILDR